MMDLKSMMVCKPTSLSQLTDSGNRMITEEDIKELTVKGEVISTSVRDEDDFMDIDFNYSQYWIVTLATEGVKVFVDTQGYDYPRYVGMFK